MTEPAGDVRALWNAIFDYGKGCAAYERAAGEIGPEGREGRAKAIDATTEASKAIEAALASLDAPRSARGRWNRALTTDEAKALSANPWQMFAAAPLLPEPVLSQREAGERVRQHLQARGESMTDAAARWHVSVSFISQVCSGGKSLPDWLCEEVGLVYGYVPALAASPVDPSNALGNPERDES